MLLQLVKIRLKALYEMIFGRRLGKKGATTRMKVLVAVFAVYIISMLFFSVGTMMYQIAGPMAEAGLDWLYFAIAGIMAAVLSIMGSIFTIHKELFDAKDNELLLSMPITYSNILASRLAVIIALEFIYTVLIMLPAGVVYAFIGGAVTVQGAVTLITASFLLMLLVLAIGTLFGWLVGLLLTRVRAKTLLTTLFMLAFLGLYFWFYFNLNKYLTTLIAEGASIAGALQKALPPAYSFGMAVTAGGLEGLKHLGIFALWCLVPFGVTYFILTRTFLKLATSTKPTVNIEYRKQSMKQSGVVTALIRKELTRFFTTPIYFINCGLGAIFMLIFAGFAVVKPDKISGILSFFPAAQDLIAPALCAVLSFCALMCCITAPSLSLEGKSLWILKAHPIRPADIFRAKIACNLIVCLPCTVISAAVLTIVFPLTAVEAAMVVILPSVVVCFTAMFGMVMNILFPRFDWINETVVVKQSASVMAAVLGGMAIVAIPVMLFFAAYSIMSAEMYLILCAAVFAAASVALYAWTVTRGVKRFENM